MLPLTPSTVHHPFSPITIRSFYSKKIPTSSLSYPPQLHIKSHNSSDEIFPWPLISLRGSAKPLSGHYHSLRSLRRSLSSFSSSWALPCSLAVITPSLLDPALSSYPICEVFAVTVLCLEFWILRSWCDHTNFWFDWVTICTSCLKITGTTFESSSLDDELCGHSTHGSVLHLF